MKRFLLPLAALAAACAPTIKFASQDIAIHAPKDKDRFELTLVYEGVQPGRSHKAAVEWLGQARQGEKRFFVGFWSLGLDFESAEEGDEDEATKMLARSIEVTRATLAVDDQDRLCLRQEIVWKDVSKCFATMNKTFHDFLREGLEKQEDLTETTFEMIELHLEKGTPILELTADAIELRIPVGREDLREGMKEMELKDLEDVREFFMAGQVSWDEAMGLHVRWIFDKERKLVLRYEDEVEARDPKWREPLGELPKREF